MTDHNRPETGEVTFLTSGMERQLIETLGSRSSSRDRICIGLALEVGATARELAEFSSANLLADGLLLQRDGPEDKTVLPISESLRKLITEYFSALGVTTLGLKARDVQNLWTELEKELSIRTKGWEVFRDTFGIKLYQISGSISAVRNLLGLKTDHAATRYCLPHHLADVNVYSLPYKTTISCFSDTRLFVAKSDTQNEVEGKKPAPERIPKQNAKQENLPPGLYCYWSRDVRVAVLESHKRIRFLVGVFVVEEDKETGQVMITKGDSFVLRRKERLLVQQLAVWSSSFIQAYREQFEDKTQRDAVEMCAGVRLSGKQEQDSCWTMYRKMSRLKAGWPDVGEDYLSKPELWIGVHQTQSLTSPSTYSQGHLLCLRLPDKRSTSPESDEFPRLNLRAAYLLAIRHFAPFYGLLFSLLEAESSLEFSSPLIQVPSRRVLIEELSQMLGSSEEPAEKEAIQGLDHDRLLLQCNSLLMKSLASKPNPLEFYYGLRFGFDRMIVQSAAGNASIEDIRVLKNNLKAMGRCLADWRAATDGAGHSSRELFSILDTSFHLAIFNASGAGRCYIPEISDPVEAQSTSAAEESDSAKTLTASREVSPIEAWACSLYGNIRKYSFGSGEGESNEVLVPIAQTIYDEHRAIYEAIFRRDVPRAKHAIRTHLTNASRRGASLIVKTEFFGSVHLVLDGNDVPDVSEKTIGPPDFSI